MRGRPTDHAGKRYGRLLALECVGKRGDRPELYWRCRCNPEWDGCGRLATVNSWSLSKGWTRSCGCLVVDIVRRSGACVPVFGPDGESHPSVAAAARAIGMSPRTVRERLATPGSGWRRAAVATAPGMPAQVAGRSA